MLARALLFLAVAALSGCYTLHAANGQLGILWGRRTIASALASPDLDPERRKKLELVLDVRRYAVEVIGLEAGSSYTYYYDTGGGPVAWNVSASAPDALAPVHWSFPIVGTIPYLGYFDRPRAQRSFQQLADQGHDALLLPVPAYSTLGWFADPVFSSMLTRDEASIAETVIHELAHATVWVRGDAEFNETLATFIGRQGALDYFMARGGPDDPGRREVLESARESEVFNGAMAALRAELQRIYEATGPRARKLELKAEAFARFRERYRDEVHPQIPDSGYDFVLSPDVVLNNALVLSFQRYFGELELFFALYEQEGRDLARTVRSLATLERERDPRAALEGLLAPAPNPEPAPGNPGTENPGTE